MTVDLGFDLSILGVEKNIPKVNFTEYSGLMVAPPKFGKTTTASKFPNAIIIPFEDGTKGQVANVLKNMRSWKDFMNFVKKLEDNREAIGNSIQTIVFDTVNKAYDMVEPYTLALLSRLDGKKYSKPSDVPHGGFYPARDKNFSKEIDRITKLGFSILFLSHSKVKTIRPKNGEPYDVYSSTMPDRLEAIVNPLVDFIIYGERRVIDEESTRVLITQGTNMSDTGSRVRLESDIPFETEEEAMKKFQAEFRTQIEALLAKEGITEDIESISKRQEEEKMSEVKDYVADTTNKNGVANLVAEIDDVVATMTKEHTSELKAQLKSELKSVAYKKYTEIDQLEQALQIAKDIVSA